MMASQPFRHWGAEAQTYILHKQFYAYAVWSFQTSNETYFG